MRGSSRDAVEEFEELRRLLLSRERQELEELRDQVTNKEKRSRDIAAVLPEAVKMSRESGDDELAGALRPTIEHSVQESIEKRPETFVNALHPIIGPIVRRSLAESMRRLLQSLNQSLEHTFSWRGLKWRFEALRTGKSFAEVVMLRSLVYRVEQVFLIHRATSLALLHVSADPALSRDSDMVAGMLSAIQDFARDSFQTGADSNLDEFRMGELQVWIAPGQSAYLAAVIRGNPSRELRTTLEDAIDSIHTLKGSTLANFDGDPAVFESLRPELENCLRAQYAEKKAKSRPTRAWFLLTLLAALVPAALLFFAPRSSHRSQF
ncbi:MAG: OmpA family protein, partial [Chthoniobacterales bacterium]